MPHAALLLVFALELAAAHPSGTAQPAVTDADLVRGIRQVDDGDYDAAILTLDNAARRLSADPAKAKELSEAYLYLGIAYLGKGHEGAAKAKFREAIKQIHDLSLSPEKFPPKVINLFEEAKDEVTRSPQDQASSGKTAQKKGGSKTVLLVAGGVALAGGAVAAAAGGGGGATATTTTTLAPRDNRKTAMFSGTLENHDGLGVKTYQVDATGTGTLDAVVTWLETNSLVSLSLSDSTTTLKDSGQTGQTQSSLSFQVTPQTYIITVKLQSQNPANYTLTVRYP